MDKHENITDGWIYTHVMVPKQIMTKEHCELIFENVGTMMMKYIEENKMTIPDGDFIALVGVRFKSEKDYEKKPFAIEKDPNADTTYVKE